MLDAGALIALERDEQRLWERVEDAHLTGRPPLTHGGVVAQVWRGGSGRQKCGGNDGDAVAAAVGVGTGGDDGGVCQAGADGALQPVQMADVIV